MSPAPTVIPVVPKNFPRFFKSKSFIIALIAVVLLVVAYIVSTVVFKTRPLFGPKLPTIKLETQYQNPFNRHTQYANPFDEYKNPFSSL